MMSSPVGSIITSALAVCAVAATFGAPAARADAPRPFKDCAACPEMVALPAGRFAMGATKAIDRQAKPYEGPVRAVSIRPFAIGRNEVTFAEWDACVAAGGCRYRPREPSFRYASNGFRVARDLP